MELPQKAKNRAIIWPSNSTLRYVFRKNKNANLKRYMYPDVHSSTICNTQDVEAIYVYIDTWINKEDVVYIQWNLVALGAQLCLSLCDPMCSLPGSSVYGNPQARILEWAAGPFSKWKTAPAAKSLQSCLTLCDPTDGSPPGSPVPGILQARTLE